MEVPKGDKFCKWYWILDFPSSVAEGRDILQITYCKNNIEWECQTQLLQPLTLGSKMAPPPRGDNTSIWRNTTTLMTKVRKDEPTHFNVDHEYQKTSIWSCHVRLGFVSCCLSTSQWSILYMFFVLVVLNLLQFDIVCHDQQTEAYNRSRSLFPQKYIDFT